MAFITDTEELKPGLIIFHRTDVKHRDWYLPATRHYAYHCLIGVDVRSNLSTQFLVRMGLPA